MLSLASFAHHLHHSRMPHLYPFLSGQGKTQIHNKMSISELQAWEFYLDSQPQIARLQAIVSVNGTSNQPRLGDSQLQHGVKKQAKYQSKIWRPIDNAMNRLNNIVTLGVHDYYGPECEFRNLVAAMDIREIMDTGVAPHEVKCETYLPAKYENTGRIDGDNVLEDLLDIVLEAPLDIVLEDSLNIVVEDSMAVKFEKANRERSARLNLDEEFEKNYQDLMFEGTSEITFTKPSKCGLRTSLDDDDGLSGLTLVKVRSGSKASKSKRLLPCAQKI